LAQTSGATPLVAGAISNVISFLPDLDLSEAKLLLKGTAIPTLNSVQSPSKNGVGTLNAYKLVKVAERLKGLSKAERDQLLQAPDHKIFDFSDEARKDYEEGVRLLSKNDCASNQQGFILLRKSFLLDPNSVDAQQSLSFVHDQIGLKKNGQFYLSLKKENLEKQIVAGLASSDDEERASAIRSTELLGMAALPYLMKAMDDSSSKNVKITAMSVASNMGKDGVPIFEKALSQQWSSNEVSTIAYTAQNLGADGARLIEKMASDKNAYLRGAALGGIQVLPQKKALSLLMAGINEKADTIQLGALRGAATLRKSRRSCTEGSNEKGGTASG
jgi:hypothetical protein